MKNLFKVFVPMAAAAIALVSCQKEADKFGSTSGNITSITVYAQSEELKGDDVTKSYIDANNAILWGDGESMVACIGDKFAVSSDVDAAGLSTAAFSFTFEGLSETGPYLFQGLYPASTAVASNNTKPELYKVNLPATQTATASSYDPAAYIMVAKPESRAETSSSWRASFRRATALNKITLKNIPSGVFIKRVQITVTPSTGKSGNYYLAGSRHINLATSTASEVLGDIYSGGGRTQTIEVKFATPQAGGANIDVWFTSWGVELGEGDSISIVAYRTDKKSYTKDITLPYNTVTSIKFKEGYLNTLSANMSGISPEDVTELEEGNYVVLAKDGDNYYALKAEKEDNKQRLLSVAYEGSIDSYLGDADIIWNLTKSGDSFIFENDSKYLGYKGSSNESYWLEADENWTTTNYLLDVTAQQTAGLYYVTLHSNSARYLSKNSSDPFFAFYGNTSQKADIVFVPATVDTRAGVTLSFEESSFALTKGSTDYNNFKGQDVTASPNVTAITDNLDWSYTNTDGVIDETNSSDYAIALSGETGTATVTVSFAGDQTYKAATACYTITVSDAGGPEYVLVSAANDVVAGDYIITWDNSYYLPSGSTSGTNPAVGTGITVANNKITNTVTSDMVWTFTGDNTNGFTISDGTNILHSTNAAQGISITTNSTRKWTASVDATYGMLLRGDDGGTRNLAVYNSGSWRYYATGNNYSGTLRLYKLDNSNVTPTVATPTFSLDVTSHNVTIACTTDGATIYYTVDGSNPSSSSSEYSAAIDISGSQQKTVKAFATKSGYDDSAVASETYYAINRAATTHGTVSAVNYATAGEEITLTITPESGYALDQLSVVDGSDNAVTVTNNKFTMPASPVTVSATFAVVSVSYDFETVAELNDLVTTSSASYNGYLTNAIVSFVPTTGTAFVKDATGSVMVYKSSHGLLQGQTYTGEITVTAIQYNSLYSEITAWSGATFSGSQAAVSPESVSLADLIGHYDDYQNAYVSVAGLTVESVSSKNINVTDGTNTYVVFDNPGSASCVAGDVITAVGTITKFGTTEELKVWAAEDITITGSAPKAITFSQPAAGGSFTVSVGGSPITSGTTVASGTTVTLTATPASGYSFGNWTVSGASVINASNAQTSFVMGTSAVTVSASFVADTITEGDPWYYTFDANPFSNNSADLTYSSKTLSWSTSIAPGYTNEALSFGTNNNPAAATLSTSSYTDGVSSIAISIKGNSGRNVTAAVSVGGTALKYGENTTVTQSGNTLTTYEFVADNLVSGQIVISFTDPSGGYQIKAIKINPEPVVLSSITISGQITQFTQNGTFSFGGTVTAHYSDDSIADVTNSATFSGYNMSTTGSQTVTVSYTEGGVTKTTSYTINVSEASGSTKRYTLTIDASSFNTTSYAANNNEKSSTATATDNSTMSVSWTSNQVMKSGNNMQWQKSKGYIYNSTDLGTIVSVTVNSSAGSFTTYYGTSAQPSSGNAGSGKGYFKTSVGSATGTTSSIVIVFDK